jgi:hypothetical protein
MRKAIMKSTWLFIAVIWTVPLVLVLLLVFSIYPNYLLRGHHGRVFVQARQLSDSIVQKVLPQKIRSSSSIVLDATSIEPNYDGGVPQRINMPLVVTLQPDQVPQAAYFSAPSKPLMFGPAMIPDPFTTYAPLPGTITGLVSHNRQQFRYPTDLGKKQKNELRIFITGGSVAWGSAASGTEFTIAGAMEKELRKKYPGVDIKVITAAAGGWVSTQERIWIFNRITAFDPDMIISYSGHNDLESYLRKEDLYDRYALEGAYFRYAIQFYDRYNRGEAISMLAINDTGSRFQDNEFPGKTLKNTKIINSYLKSEKIKYVYVLQPVAKKKEFSFFYELYSQLGSELAHQAQRDGYRYIDHSGLLDGRPELLIDFCHPGDRGYQAIADDLVLKTHADLAELIAAIKK